MRRETLRRRPRRGGAAALAGLLLLAGCAGVGPLPAVDLTDPGWTVWRGQGVWRPGPDAPSLVGELIVARHASGDRLVSFSKPPLPIFTAQTAGGAWRIDFVERGRSVSGRGRPPARRFAWFALPAVLEGAPPPSGWRLERPAEDEWRLSHPRRGESIRLVLDPAGPAEAVR